jgi:hypothetical protein
MMTMMKMVTMMMMRMLMVVEGPNGPQQHQQQAAAPPPAAGAAIDSLLMPPPAAPREQTGESDTVPLLLIYVLLINQLYNGIRYMLYSEFSIDTRMPVTSVFVFNTIPVISHLFFLALIFKR